MTNPIIVVVVSVTNAPAPATLLATGAFLSCGGTTLTPGTYQVLSTDASLASILTPAATITSITWSGGTATVTTAAAHGIPSGATIQATIAGATPTGYNGNFAATYASATTFTYPLASNPGSETVPGTWQPTSAVELTQMNTTYWAQGTNVAPYVLELGLVAVNAAVTALGNFITASPQFFSRYLVSRSWVSNSAFQTFVGTFAAPNNITYFHIPVGSATYTNFADAKAAICCAEAPNLPATEYTAAARFALELATAPSSSSPLAPMSYRYVFGCTSYPTTGNTTLLTAFNTADVDYIGTGSQGGISYQIIYGGNNMDGNPFTFWYATDWGIVNLALDLANAVINGSNTSQNPLYFDQTGINRLKAVSVQTLTNGGTFGMYMPGFTVSAVPFTTFVQQNPSDYEEGLYNGLSASAVPKRGFLNIVFNLNVSNLG